MTQTSPLWTWSDTSDMHLAVMLVLGSCKATCESHRGARMNGMSYDRWTTRTDRTIMVEFEEPVSADTVADTLFDAVDAGGFGCDDAEAEEAKTCWAIRAPDDACFLDWHVQAFQSIADIPDVRMLSMLNEEDLCTCVRTNSAAFQ